MRVSCLQRLRRAVRGTFVDAASACSSLVNYADGCRSSTTSVRYDLFNHFDSHMHTCVPCPKATYICDRFNQNHSGLAKACDLTGGYV